MRYKSCSPSQVGSCLRTKAQYTQNESSFSFFYEILGDGNVYIAVVFNEMEWLKHITQFLWAHHPPRTSHRNDMACTLAETVPMDTSSSTTNCFPWGRFWQVLMHRFTAREDFNWCKVNILGENKTRAYRLQLMSPYCMWLTYCKMPPTPPYLDPKSLELFMCSTDIKPKINSDISNYTHSFANIDKFF